MSTIPLTIASASRAPGSRIHARPFASSGERPSRYQPARGVMLGLVAGAGLWAALLTGLGIL